MANLNKKMFQKLDKKSLLYLGIVVGTFLLALGLIWYFSRVPEKKIIEEKPEPTEPKEKTIEEVIQGLTAPEGGDIEPIPEEVLKELTVPDRTKPKPVPEEIIRDLTAPK